VCAFLGLVVLMLGFLAWSVRHSSVTLGPDSIRLYGDLWGRTIPRTALDVDHARVVDLASEPELTPRSRRMGTGMPGYAAGWFGLANGEKALVYLTTRDRVVYVPTREGYALLLSVDAPDAFLAALGAR
jgi:hypothetical protein